MANKKVSVYKQVRVNGVWVKCPPYFNPKNNKPENDKVLVKGKLEVHPEGDWGVFYYEGGKRKWEKVGPKYAAAKDAADIKELALKGRAKGLIVEERGAKTSLRTAVGLFLEQYTAGTKTYQLLDYDLHEFCDWVRKEHVEDITRTDLLRYKEWLQKTPEKPRASAPHKKPKLRSLRTACNKVGEVNQFHRWFMKLEPGKGLITGKDIKPVKKRVQIFSQEELKAFFAACTPTQNLIFSTFLMSGIRKQELMYLEWDDVDFEKAELRVVEKLRSATRDYEFSPKTDEERDISIPDDLLERLAEHKKTVKHRLVFPTRTGKPNDKIWDMCRNIAHKAGLDESTFFVHKFRATYASLSLQRGVDLKTVQEQLGHREMESTQRYLVGLKNRDKRASMNRVWGSEPAAQVLERQSLEDELKELESL